MIQLALLLSMMSAASPSLRIESAPRGDTFTFQATDVHGAISNVATVTVLPTVVAPQPGRLVATDVDGDALTYSIVTQGKNGAAEITNAATGEFIYTPHESVTLTPEGADPVIAYTLQRSTDLAAWADIGVFIPGSPLNERRVSPQQFYRLSWQQGVVNKPRIRVISL